MDPRRGYVNKPPTKRKPHFFDTGLRVPGVRDLVQEQAQAQALMELQVSHDVLNMIDMVNDCRLDPKANEGIREQDIHKPL